MFNSLCSLPLFTRRCRQCWLVLSLLAGLFNGNAWAAQDRIVSRAYWDDPTASASVEAAREQIYTPYSQVLSRGYTDSATWVKLRIDPTGIEDANEALVVRIRPVYLDEIDLFDPLDASGKTRKTGDLIAYGQEEYRSLAHTFVIPAGQQARDIWLRVKTHSTSMLHAEVYTQRDMLAKEHQLLLIYYFVLAMITVFLVMVFINWMQYRDYLYAVFVVRHALYLVFALSNFGFHRLLLDGVVAPETLELGYSWLVIAATGFSFWFESRFLSEYSPPFWANLVIRFLLLCCLAATVLLACDQVLMALRLNMLLNGLGVLCFLVLSMLIIDDRHAAEKKVSSLLKKKWVVSYYAFITVLLSVSVLPSLGSMAGSEMSTNALVFYALCSGAVMTVLMQMRANQLRRSSLQAQQELVLQIQRTEIEKERRQEQSQLLTMLMHELKNPLAVIDLSQHDTQDAQTREYVTRNVNIIKNILDRCINADRLADGKFVLHPQSLNVVKLVKDWVGKHLIATDRFDVRCAQAVLMVQADLQCLTIMLNNLMDNALRYAAADSTIQIDICERLDADARQGVCVQVSNRPGFVGFPDAQRVFKKYYRSAGAKTESGTGLGLYLVKTLAQSMGVVCTYAPDDEQVRFELWIPT